jgi:hypothetical protein
MNRRDIERNLRIISKAWGKKQSGYAFFPYIDREAQKASGSRKAGFHEGPAFKWPADREAIITHCLSHTREDLYWSCNLFEYPIRREDAAMDEHALWADLDKVDPSTLDEYPPTIAWETSPGSYQALWIAASGDFQGASWAGNENQRMTYMTGADTGGWFATKLLRFPEWDNHKPEYEENGKFPKGQVLWTDGPTYHPGDFASLPEIQGVSGSLTDALETDIENVDRHAVLARVKLKLNRKARELLAAREVSGDRSDSLWYLIRCLADAGCSVAEIVAIVRESVWNKFKDRGDEVKRLMLEASKAIAQRSEETVKAAEFEEEEIERSAPQRLGFLLANIKRPRYVIDKILTEGSCGFIAGEPKCYKSWVGLDMILSVATGAPFMGEFRVTNPGPVLYIQEEDPPSIIKQRSAKIWSGKSTDKFELQPDSNEILWLPPERSPEFDPDINAYIQKGVIISDEAWQLWLDDTIAAGMDGEAYRMILVDTLMMTAGDVEETRAQEMTTKIFKPLKTLARKHNIAVVVIHHMGKADKPRSGQRMLGSVANHAWSEDSIYLSRSGAENIKMEVESKTAPGGTYRIDNLANTRWEPHIGPWRPEDAPVTPPHQQRQPGARSRRPATPGKADVSQAKLIEVVKMAGTAGITTAQVAEALSINRSTAHKRLVRQLEYGTVDRQQTPDGSNAWAITEAEVQA